MASNFLTARWEKLVMANYEIDPSLLEKYLPFGTELDLLEGKCIVSLIGFMFLNTKLKGIKIPFHSNFEEVNLRFYVKHLDGNEWKRGVVFIKEIVPKPAITLIANTLYQEHYHTMRMNHHWEITDTSLQIEYAFFYKNQWHSFRITSDTNAYDFSPNSEEAFITEHYWGYTRISKTKTSEYEVVHPTWKVYPTREYSIHVDFQKVYGADFACLNTAVPRSVFLAEGSDVAVKGKSK
jgi:uncharacterized protein YqjF (DUF2071 family)